MRDSSFLLRGKDLAEAEQWVANSGEKEPKPTTLQSQYILASRQAATKQQRLIIGAVVAAFVLAVGLAVYAFIQKELAQRETKEAEHQRNVAETNATEAQRQKKATDDNAEEATRQKNTAVKNEVEAKRQEGIAREETTEAEHQARIANSRRLAATALLHKDDQLDLASLLSIEAYRTADTFETRNALLTTFQANPRLVASSTVFRWADLLLLFSAPTVKHLPRQVLRWCGCGMWSAVSPLENRLQVTLVGYKAWPSVRMVKRSPRRVAIRR